MGAVLGDPQEVLVIIGMRVAKVSKTVPLHGVTLDRDYHEAMVEGVRSRRVRPCEQQKTHVLLDVRVLRLLIALFSIEKLINLPEYAKLSEEQAWADGWDGAPQEREEAVMYWITEEEQWEGDREGESNKHRKRSFR